MEPDSGRNVASVEMDKNASNVKWFPAYKRSDKLKQAILSKIKILDEYFNLLEKIGEGTFSTVQLATLKSDPSRKFAVKNLVPTCHPSRIIRELQCLQTIGGRENVIGVTVCLRSNDRVAFVMPYLPNQKFCEYVLKMDAAEVQLYMKNLLIALQRVHSFGIIHRDIKPSNFLYDRENKKFLLIDFGLAQPVEELAPKDNLRSEKKRKRDTLNENVENTQKKKEESMEPTAGKRPVLKPLINNASIHRSVSKKRTKQDSASLSSVTSNDPKNNDSSVEKTHLTFMFNSSLNLAEKEKSANETSTYVPKIFHSPEADQKSRTEPSCSSQKFQLLKTNPKSSCNKISNFLVQDSQVKEKTGSDSANRNNAADPAVFPQPTRRAPSKKPYRPCSCSGKGQICNACMTRKAPNAARAGTPGYRPPEVLLNYQYQTTAVDIWAAGVILISILSGCAPFFRAVDDVSALAEIMTVFGTTNVKNMASKLGINITCNVERKPFKLQVLCEELRRRKFQRRSKEDETWEKYPVCCVCCTRKHPKLGCVCSLYEESPAIRFPEEAYDFLEKLLALNPNERITACEALDHPFLTMEL